MFHFSYYGLYNPMIMFINYMPFLCLALIGTAYIKGTIQAEPQSHLITSIPYDEGFTIYVDGKKTEIEKVNTAFLGCKLSEGKHQIEIQYSSKGFSLGVFLTVLGSICCILILGIKKISIKAKP